MLVSACTAHYATLFFTSAQQLNPDFSETSADQLNVV